MCLARPISDKLICAQDSVAYLHADIASFTQGKLGTLQVDAHVQHGRQEALVDLPLYPPALAGCACGLHLHVSIRLSFAGGSVSADSIILSVCVSRVLGAASAMRWLP